MKLIPDSNLGLGRVADIDGSGHVLRSDAECSASRYSQFRSDMSIDLQGIVINEMPNAVMRNASSSCPLSKRSNGRFTTDRKDTRLLKRHDIDH